MVRLNSDYLDKKILRVDLSTGGTKDQSLSRDLFRKYIGGMGTGTKILSEIDPETDAFSPENKLIFSIGPLTGTTAPMFAQTCVVTKSPLTKGALNTYAGGFFGAEFSRTDYSHVVFEGVAEEPSLLYIDEGDAKLMDASDEWGLGVSETQKSIKEKIGEEVKIARIGLGGENQVLYSCIIAGRGRAFGRGGAGAVMGSKNLKAFVVKGREMDFKEDEEFSKAVKKARKKLNESIQSETSSLGLFSRQGTIAGLPMLAEMDILSTRNHQEGVFEGADKIGPEYFGENIYKDENVACFGCPVACGREAKLTEASGGGERTKGPEYETAYSLGSNCGVDSGEAIAKANKLCEEYGMDTLSVGVNVSYAMECYERGILSEDDVGGLELEFGNGEAMVELIKMIGEREGIGDLLAQGTKRAAEEIGEGTDSFAMQVKGMEFAAWMPEVMRGIACTFATSNRGACHKRAIIGDELSGEVDPLSYEDKARLTKDIQDRVNAIFTLIACRFSEFALPVEIYVDLLNAAMGVEFSKEEFLKVGERIWNLERVFSGFTREDDGLPDRCFEHKIPSGNYEGAHVDRGKFEEMLEDYYELRGWNENGVPTEAKLKDLDLEDWIGSN